MVDSPLCSGRGCSVHWVQCWDQWVQTRQSLAVVTSLCLCHFVTLSPCHSLSSASITASPSELTSSRQLSPQPHPHPHPASRLHLSQAQHHLPTLCLGLSTSPRFQVRPRHWKETDQRHSKHTHNHHHQRQRQRQRQRTDKTRRLWGS